MTDIKSGALCCTDIGFMIVTSGNYNHSDPRARSRIAYNCARESISQRCAFSFHSCWQRPSGRFQSTTALLKSRRSNAAVTAFRLRSLHRTISKVMSTRRYLHFCSLHSIVQNHFTIDNCRKSAGENGDNRVAALTLGIGTCGVTRQRTLNPPGIFVEGVVVIR